MEWMPAAFALRSFVSNVIQELMTSLGMPRNIRLEEVLGPRALEMYGKVCWSDNKIRAEMLKG